MLTTKSYMQLASLTSRLLRFRFYCFLLLPNVGNAASKQPPTQPETAKTKETRFATAPS